MSQAITYSEARQNLAETMNRVCDHHEPVIITRQKSPSVVMMSLEDYNSIMETAYLLRSPANAVRLREAIQAADTGKAIPHELEDYLYWQHTDKRTVKRINELLRDAMRNPFEGMGKPEPLRFDLAGCWSRRINQEDRLVYKVDERSEGLIVLQCRYHY